MTFHLIRYDRQAEKEETAAVSEEEEDDPPAATSDVERPDDGSDAEEAKPKPKPKKKKGKGKAGVVVPEDWPWEEAKKVFKKPDVTPADDIEVTHNIGCSNYIHASL